MKIKIENILSDLERIKHLISQYEDISLIPDIERDILLSLIRDVYSGLLQIPGTKLAEHSEKDVSSAKPDGRELPHGTTERVEFVEEEHLLKSKKLEPVQKTNSQPTKEVIHSKKTEESKKTKLETLADKLQQEKQFVYETLAEKASQQNISSKLQSKPISSISSAIGINDKFKLIRNLFNGDTETFIKTVENLDACNNFNEAFNYISTNFNWDMEDDSVQFILDLIRRKFIVDKDE